MPVSLTREKLLNAGHPSLAAIAEPFKNLKPEVTVDVDLSKLPLDAIMALQALGETTSDRSLARVVKAFLAAREGDFTHKIAKFEAAPEIVANYLRHNLIDGWIYVMNDAGLLSPELVLSVGLHTDASAYNRSRSFYIDTMATKPGEDRHHRRSVSPQKRRHAFSPEEVRGKTPFDLFESAGIRKETPELKAEYEKALAYHVDTVMPAFAEQFRFTGRALERGSRLYKALDFVDRKVINDLMPSDYGSVCAYASSTILGSGPLVTDRDEDEDFEVDEEGLIPFHPAVSVFDLKTFDFLWVDSRCLVPYVYDKSLADKLVLPETHRGLLDVLTQDLYSFTGDIVEGKTTGNVILCTGVPGIGKTLTAEVYAERLERPLYAIHSGNLGTTAKDVQSNLQVIFARAKRWNCVLLLDEADVFVQERGNSIEQNAIVAEFLRTLEYYDNLLFLTSNRQNSIDDAILSRCLAIIRFSVPDERGAARIWDVVSEALGHPLEASLVERLVEMFPGAAGRDMKNLAGMVFRVVKSGRWALDEETFRLMAAFRGVDMLKSSRHAPVEGVSHPGIAAMLSEVQSALEARLGFRPTGEQAMQALMSGSPLISASGG